MHGLFNLATSVYRGYAGDGERHNLRVLLIIVISIIIAASPKSLNSDAISTIAVIVSVLGGFSFTALFSNYSHSISDLPPAKSESERLDLINLTNLFNNFRDRSKYFLTICVMCLLVCFLVIIPFDVKKFFSEIFPFLSVEILNTLQLIWNIFCFIIRLLCLLLFFEIMYSFYRLSQTIFAILDTRRVYLEETT